MTVDSDDFFSLQNSVKNISYNDSLQTSNYLESIKALARLNNHTVYVINYKDKGFDYVSDNPLFLCGHSAKDVQDMGYEFYIKYVPQNDLELLLKINQLGFDFYDKVPKEEVKEYLISYDFHLKNKENKEILINHKMTPLFLNSDGKLWKALCLVSLSSSNSSGNIKIFKSGNQKILEYNEVDCVWNSVKPIILNEREKEILLPSIRAFSVDEMAEELFLSSNTIKFHRKSLFEKLNVSNISEAISLAKSHYLI